MAGMPFLLLGGMTTALVRSSRRRDPDRTLDSDPPS
jgi:hypothetical protein